MRQPASHPGRDSSRRWRPQVRVHWVDDFAYVAFAGQGICLSRHGSLFARAHARMRQPIARTAWASPASPV